MKLVSRYIATRVLKGIALAFVIVTSLIMLVDFVEATRNIGNDGQFSLFQIAALTLLRTPQLIEETVPFVILFGVMGALYSLNKRSELVVLRASGLSAWRFLWPAVAVSAAIGLIWTTAFNPLAAKSMEKYQDTLISAAQTDDNQNSAPSQTETLWLREGTEAQQIVIRGQVYPNRPLILHDVTFYFYNVTAQTEGRQNYTTTGQTSYSERIDAKTAQLSPSGYWQLTDIIRNMNGGEMVRAMTTSIPTKITPTQLKSDQKILLKTPFWALPRDISAARDAGFSTVRLSMQWHRLLSLPLMLIALTIVAAGVSMGNVRSGGTIRLMLGGAAIGFLVYFFNNLISAFGEAQTLSVIMASWAVPVLVLFLGLAYLTRIEDG